MANYFLKNEFVHDKDHGIHETFYFNYEALISLNLLKILK